MLFPLEREDLFSDVMEMCALNPTIRPFELSIDDIRKICDAYAKIVEREPEIYNYDYRQGRNSKERRNKRHVISAFEEKILTNASNVEVLDSEPHLNLQDSKWVYWQC